MKKLLFFSETADNEKKGRICWFFSFVYLRLLRNIAAAATMTIMMTAAMAMYISVKGKPAGLIAGEGVVVAVEVGVEVGGCVVGTEVGVGLTLVEGEGAVDTRNPVSA